MIRILPLRRFTLIAIVAAALLGLGGCSAIRDYYANDHSWIGDQQYAVARELFIQTGSLDLVQKRLVDLEWRRSERNEALYRLQKEFELMPEEVATVAKPPVPTRRPALSSEATTPTTHIQIPIESVVPSKILAPRQ